MCMLCIVLNVVPDAGGSANAGNIKSIQSAHAMQVSRAAIGLWAEGLAEHMTPCVGLVLYGAPSVP